MRGGITKSQVFLMTDITPEAVAADIAAIEGAGKRWHGEDHRVVQVRWEPYKPDGQRQMKAKGRWQEQVGSGDFWRWQNCDRPKSLAATEAVGVLQARVEDQERRIADLTRALQGQGNPLADQLAAEKARADAAEAQAKADGERAADLMIQHMRRAEAAEAKVARLVEVGKRVLEPLDEPCRHDHHGYCQAHFVEADCSVAALRAIIAEVQG